MKKLLRMMMYLVLSAFLVTGMISSASALVITPDTVFRWQDVSPVNPNATDVAGIVGFAGILDELYKMDVGAGSDTGSFASSYATTFMNIPTDPADADIAYVGGSYITGSPLYLLIKDGQHLDPYWYIFDLNNIGGNSWNGTDTLELRGFWPNQGAISHVAIYGDTAPVPEPATMLLLGTGLLTLVGLGRKKLLK